MKVKEVTNNIRDLRYNADNMSQQQLSELVGCSRQTINALEKNRYSPSFVLVKKIAMVFNVSINEVIEIEFDK
ncbi:MAG: helix-turn-helix domain-containing protein [Firmicutes bacterium]|nr:helix-turn-helix domain-containing protein [Bacillota bacterium]